MKVKEVNPKGLAERMQVKTLCIEPGSPWENGYIESFNGKLRAELLNRGRRLQRAPLVARWVEANSTGGKSIGGRSKCTPASSIVGLLSNIFLIFLTTHSPYLDCEHRNRSSVNSFCGEFNRLPFFADA
jgi:transposase InsO family protein